MIAEVHIVNAFTIDGKGGNPAGIVLNDEDFSTVQKQAIALRAGLSETAFVSGSAFADFKLEFFTPTRQIPHCGHATVATFYYLNQLGKTGSKSKLVKETIDGNREIHLMEGEVYMEQKAPRYAAPQKGDIAKIFQSLGLQPHQKLPELINTGNTFILLEVENEEVLASLKPDFAAIAALTEKYGATGYYVFCTTVNGFDATARMFAPAYGIDEESATGMASGPLAAYFYKHYVKKGSYRFEQGRFMQPASPSSITVRVNEENGAISSLFAGGKATLTGKITISL